jgi:hypothetical protein
MPTAYPERYRLEEGPPSPRCVLASTRRRFEELGFLRRRKDPISLKPSYRDRRQGEGTPPAERGATSTKHPDPDSASRRGGAREQTPQARRLEFRRARVRTGQNLLPELGHLKPGACGPERIARLIRDLEERGLAPASIRRYLSPLAAIFKLARRRRFQG